ncbi:glutamate--cysteine ligase [Marinivivus vitaminiproducens]|uniref:glutamate--cysteine ligase n=1 Tax=Marinivivus vitaminiproducens TaxID=3035935 RepID=UPI00279D17E6|nr:glutamate--cysteine ligase [Geminicoccaceae bacterium SCSIO 64248]
MSPIIKRLNQLLVTKGDAVQSWLDEEAAKAPPPITTSVDLRHSGERLVPVDTNLFPAGFNNISDPAKRRATLAFKRAIRRDVPGAERVLLIPENHTRNQGYIANLAVLARIMAEAGVELRLGRAIDGNEEDVTLEVQDDAPLTVHALERRGPRLCTKDGFEPDAIVLNNDLSDGLPSLLRGLSQPVMPPPELGWHSRMKSAHFAAYDQVATAFAHAFDLDPWTIAAGWTRVDDVDFRTRQNMAEVAAGVDGVIAHAKAKHGAYDLPYDPYAFVKADSGTYGMGVMSVQAGADVEALNKKRRHSMGVIKGGVQNSHVVVQEGVPTADLIEGAPAEPVIYMVDGRPIGGFYRVHRDKDAYASLNAVGSAFADMCEEVDPELEPTEFMDPTPCAFRVLGLVARLAALAAGREAQEARAEEAA